MHFIPAPHWCRPGAEGPDKHGDGRVHEKMKVPEYRLSVCVLMAMVDETHELDAKPRAFCCPTQVAALGSGSQTRGIPLVPSSVERDLDLNKWMAFSLNRVPGVLMSINVVAWEAGASAS